MFSFLLLRARSSNKLAIVMFYGGVDSFDLLAKYLCFLTKEHQTSSCKHHCIIEHSFLPLVFQMRLISLGMFVVLQIP